MFLGLDLGTSGLRALLVGSGGQVVASASSPYAVSHPARGYSEQDPQIWCLACQRALADLRCDHGDALRAVRGIGVSGQMHGAVMLDGAGTVVHPAILWNDSRSHLEAAALDSIAQIRAISGNIVFPGFTAPKLAWIAKHRPEVFARIDKVLLPKDYLNYWLTGCMTSDMSDAAGTAWLDVAARRWSCDLLGLTGMRRDQMARLVEGTEIIGTLRVDRARDLGLSRAVAVVGGAGDNAAAACGIGVLDQGQGFVSLGTSGVLLLARDNFSPKAASAIHTFCHAVPDRWVQMGVILAATDALNWLGRVLGQDPATLAGTLGDRITGPGAVTFLPYLSGDRTPYNDSTVRGALLGLDIATDRGALVAGVMEGVAYALRQSFDVLTQAGTRPERLFAIGGGARSRFWLNTIATVLNTPLELPVDGEFGAAMGAARLAITGVTGAAVASVMTPPRIAETIAPRPDLVSAYTAAYQRFCRSYPAIKAIQ